MMVSALTMLELTPMNGRYARYPDFADLIRARFTDPDQTLHELFRRIVFNVIVGNIDDHARNHAAFWDDAASLVGLEDRDRQRLRGGAILNPSIFYTD